MAAPPRLSYGTSRASQGSVKLQIIQASTGQQIQVCDCHYDLVKDKIWRVARHSGYVYRMENTQEGKRRYVSIHRTIANFPIGIEVDHRDGNKQNNQCSNFRPSTREQNNQNVGRRKDNVSGYKGVGWFKVDRKWRVRIQAHKKTIFIGYFDDVVEAAKAYNASALKYHGEFARLNKV